MGTNNHSTGKQKNFFFVIENKLSAPKENSTPRKEMSSRDKNFYSLRAKLVRSLPK